MTKPLYAALLLGFATPGPAIAQEHILYNMHQVVRRDSVAAGFFADPGQPIQFIVTFAGPTGMAREVYNCHGEQWGDGQKIYRALQDLTARLKNEDELIVWNFLGDNDFDCPR